MATGANKVCFFSLSCSVLTAPVQASLRPLSKNYNLPFKQNTNQEIRDKNMLQSNSLLILDWSLALSIICWKFNLFANDYNYKVNQKGCFFLETKSYAEIISRFVSIGVNELLMNANSVSINSNSCNAEMRTKDLLGQLNIWHLYLS